MGTFPSSDRIKAVQSPEDAPPNSESHFREVLHSPEKTEEAKEIERLTRLAASDQEWSREDIVFVIKRVPLIVFADDMELVRNAVYRMIRTARGDMRSVIKLEGNMVQCFDSIPEVEEGKLPMVLCHDGKQAEEAAQIICERQIQEGVLIFDNDMGTPLGLEIFRSMQGQMPPKVARILFSGTHHKDAEKWIAEGILDHSIAKPGTPSGFLSGVAQTYLRKTLPKSPESNS